MQAFELRQLLGDGVCSKVTTIGLQGDSDGSLDLAFRYPFGKIEAHATRVDMGLGEVDIQMYSLED